MTTAISHTAAVLGLVPLLFLLALGFMGRGRDVAFWWIATAYGVSWLADLAGQRIDPFLIGALYPVTQAGIVGAVLLEPEDAMILLVALVAAGLWAIFVQGGGRVPDVLLRTVAWGSVAGVAASRPELGPMRAALVVTFGLGLLTWLAYASLPGWPTYLAYQGARAAGAVLFCVAVARAGSAVRVGLAT